MEQGDEAFALVFLGDADACDFQHRSRQVDVQYQRRDHAAPVHAVRPWIVDDERHAQRLLVVRPFSGETAFAHVVAVVEADPVLGKAVDVRCLDNRLDDTFVGGRVSAYYIEQVTVVVRPESWFGGTPLPPGHTPRGSEG